MWRKFKDFLNTNSRILDQSLLYLSLVTSVAIIAHIGSGAKVVAAYLEQSILGIFTLLGGILFLRTAIALINPGSRRKFRYGELVLLIYFLVILILRYAAVGPFFFNGWLYTGIFSICLVELSKGSLVFDRFYFNPTLLFVTSFLLLILLGTLLLLLPNATTGVPLSIVDALFMSTSAVCITGLSVIDISVSLSDFGQVVLLVLVQLGGLGVMTFTGFFGYFFSGGFSYKNQLMYTELVAENKLGSVINTLLKIVLITLSIEAIGATAIYFSVDEVNFAGNSGRTFFSMFHSISAYCNAGFSMLPAGHYDASVRFNYSFQLIVAMLFISGGLGFGIVLNSYFFVKRWAVNIYERVVLKKAFVYRAWVINFNSRLVAWTTLMLLAIGTFGILVLEYNSSLAEHQGFMAKLAGGFFMGASPRSSGFNSVDMNILSFPAILQILCAGPRQSFFCRSLPSGLRYLP